MEQTGKEVPLAIGKDLPNGRITSDASLRTSMNTNLSTILVIFLRQLKMDLWKVVMTFPFCLSQDYSSV